MNGTQATSTSTKVCSKSEGESRRDHLIGLAFAEYIPDPPVGLLMIAELMEKPVGLELEGDEQDEIINGCSHTSYEEVLIGGTYLNEFLEGLQWWVDMASAILLGCEPSISSPEHDERKSKVIAGVANVLDAYPAVLASSFVFRRDERWRENSIELIKRYRKFTRSVCDLAQEVWPDFCFVRPRRIA